MLFVNICKVLIMYKWCVLRCIYLLFFVDKFWMVEIKLISVDILRSCDIVELIKVNFNILIVLFENR